jgi:hypothetical protein
MGLPGGGGLQHRRFAPLDHVLGPRTEALGFTSKNLAARQLGMADDTSVRRAFERAINRIPGKDGLDARKKSDIVCRVAVGQPIDNEEVDIRLARLTLVERDTFMMFIGG